jgi:hypothetical protein
MPSVRRSVGGYGLAYPPVEVHFTRLSAGVQDRTSGGKLSLPIPLVPAYPPPKAAAGGRCLVVKEQRPFKNCKLG